MLDITLRVTKSPVHLEQVNQLTVHNTGNVDQRTGETLYDIYVDGVYAGVVTHKRDDGALILSQKVLEKVNRMRIRK